MKNQLSSRWNRRLIPAVFLALVVLLSIFMAACDKEIPLAGDEPSKEQEENVVTLEPAKFAYRGQLYPREEFQRKFSGTEFPIMVTGIGLPEENVVYVFDSEPNFNAWANTSPFSEKLTIVTKLASEAKQKADANSTLSVKGTMAPGGWLYLFRDIFAGPVKVYPVTSIFSSLGSFNKQASSGWLYNPPNLFPAYTICALYTSTNWVGSQIIYVNSRVNSTLKFDLTKYLFWNDAPQSLIVI